MLFKITIAKSFAHLFRICLYTLQKVVTGKKFVIISKFLVRLNKILRLCIFRQLKDFAVDMQAGNIWQFIACLVILACCCLIISLSFYAGRYILLFLVKLFIRKMIFCIRLEISIAFRQIAYFSLCLMCSVYNISSINFYTTNTAQKA